MLLPPEDTALTTVQGQDVQPALKPDGGVTGSVGGGCVVRKAGQPAQAAGTLPRQRLKSIQSEAALGTEPGVATQSPEGQAGHSGGTGGPGGLEATIVLPLKESLRLIDWVWYWFLLPVCAAQEVDM